MSSIERKYDTVLNRFAAGIIDGLIFLPVGLLFSSLTDELTAGTIVLTNILQNLLYAAYNIIGHGRYGWTIGKKAMGLKVLDLNERETIGYWRAFLRESVWIVLGLLGVVYYFVQDNSTAPFTDTGFSLADYLSLISTAWFIVEIVSTLTNPRRRAVHDLLAGSVVVDNRILEAERRAVEELGTPAA